MGEATYYLKARFASDERADIFDCIHLDHNPVTRG
jgi:hypothetical protein